MFDLNDDTGEITIDFQVVDPEHLEAEPVTSTVVVAPPPTFGAYKRLRAEINRINSDRDKLAKKLGDDDNVGISEMTSQINSFVEDSLLDWWKLVMVGDESYRGQARSAPPESMDNWPLYLVNLEAMQQALAHWKTVPLARGGQRSPQTN